MFIESIILNPHMYDYRYYMGSNLDTNMTIKTHWMSYLYIKVHIRV